MKNQRVIVCAANRSKKTGRIVCGARHWDGPMRDMALNGATKMPKEWGGAEQGFIDQAGTWLTREEAWVVAKKAGQIKYASGNTDGTLFSEDLY